MSDDNCSVAGCDGKQYKSTYCVEHFVKFGDDPTAASSDSSSSSSSLAPPASSTTQSASSPSASPSTGGEGSASAPKKKFNFGGGGVPCTTCQKTCYPAETMQFEMKPYHIDCFKCNKCNKGLDATQAALFEGIIYCKMCFSREGLHRKQAEVKWTAASPSPNSSASSSSASSKFGGGGQPCNKCNKTVYAGETMSFEGRPYHPKCLTCSDCSKECTLNELAQYEGQLYCKRCWEKGGFAAKQRNVAEKWEETAGTERRNSAVRANPLASKFGGGGTPCTKCNKTVYAGETISFEGLVYHPKCLTCTDCSKECTVNDANKFDNQLYCKRCWEKGGFAAKQRDVKWDASKAASSSSSSSAPSKFGGGGSPCTKCSNTVYAGEAVQYEGKLYHPKCVVCAECTKECTVNNVNQFENKLYCTMCWQKGGYAAKQRATAAAVTPSESKPKTSNPRFANLGGGGLKCYTCQKTVYPAETLQYESRPYHAKCFRCIHCSKEILQVAQAEHKGDKIYCNKCFMELGLWQATLN